MAKLKSIFNLEGTLGEMTFYKHRNGHYFIKRKSSISKTRIARDPAFARTRENCEEFSGFNTAGRLIRRGSSAFLNSAKDPDVVTRLVAVLAKVKNLDFNSARGKRTVGNGLLTAEGKRLLKGFDFNAKSSLGTLLLSPYSLQANYVFALQAFVPATMVRYPEHSTHVAFRTGLLRVDFELETSIMDYSAVALLPLDMTAVDLSLTPNSVPAGNGILFWMVLVEFFQEVNGVHYPLNDQTYNSFHVLDVE